MSLSPVGDSLAIARLCHDLFTKVWLVAKKAPDEFEDLKSNLKLMKGVLGEIQALDRNIDYERDDVITQNTLDECSRALREFDYLITKYKHLAETERTFSLDKVAWASDQANLRRCDERLRNCFAPLQIALLARLVKELRSSRPTSSNELEAAQRVVAETEERQRNGASIDRTSDDSVVPGQRSRAIGDLWSQLKKFRWNFWASSEGAGTNSGRDIAGRLRALKPHLNPNRQKHDTSRRLEREFAGFSRDIEQMSITQRLRIATWWLLKSRVEFDWALNRRQEDEGINSDAHRSIWKHNLSAVQARTDLLKSSWILEKLVLSEENQDEQLDHPTWNTLWNLAHGIHDDLVDRRGNGADNNEWCALLFSQSELELIESFNLNLPVEGSRGFPDADNVDDPHRWLTPDPDQAGMKNETCLRRYFVNAQMGEKNVRRKSLNLPYLLVLWCPTDKCEIWVSLINQHGTLNLQRRLRSEDTKFERDNPITGDSVPLDFPSTSVTIKFLDSSDWNDFVNYITQFFKDTENRECRQGEHLITRESLKSYQLWHNHELANRLPPRMDISSCEISLFGLVPNDCSKINRRIVISSSPAVRDRRCESYSLPIDCVKVKQQEQRGLTLKWSYVDHVLEESTGNYERKFSLVYKPDDPNRTIELSFRSSESAKRFFEFVLHPFKPPDERPEVTSRYELLKSFKTSPSLNIDIYRLSDTIEALEKVHKAIVLRKEDDRQWHLTSVFFLYHIIDFVMEDSSGYCTMDFPGSLMVQHLVSSKVDMLVRPDSPEEVDIADITTKETSSKFVFSDHNDRSKFVNLLVGWRPVFCRVCKDVRLKGHGWLSQSKAHDRQPNVGIWESSNEDGPPEIRISIRVNQNAGYRWITAALSGPTNCTIEPHGSKTVILRKLLFQFGHAVDSTTLQAVSRQARNNLFPNQERKVVISFHNKEECENFKDVFHDAIGSKLY